MASRDDVFSWVHKDDVIGAPADGIIGACSPEGRYIYVIRANYDHGKYFIAGNYEEGNDYAEFEYDGLHISSMDWEYLVSSADVTSMNISILSKCIYCNYR